MTGAALKRVAGWFDDRTGLSGATHFLDKKVVPRHRYSIFYYLGGMALFLFVVFSILFFALKVGIAAWGTKERTDKEAPYQAIPQAS